MIWPGEIYHVPYDLNQLYQAIQDVRKIQPKIIASALHEVMVNRFGSCSFTHVKAVLVLARSHGETE